MTRWNKKSRLLLFAGVAVLMAGSLVAYRHWHTRPQRYEFTTQRPGEPPQRWRSMRVAWTYLPGLRGYHQNINDLYADDKCLYYACECETGCLDKASGSLVWQHRFLTQSAAENGPSPNFDRVWRISRNGRFLYACECLNSNSYVSAPFPLNSRLCALDAQTGEVLWEHTVLAALLAPPCASGDLLLLPTASGSVLALRQRDGETAWERKMTATPSERQEHPPDMALRVAEGIGVLQIGGRLVSFRVEDGKPLWARPAAGHPARAAEQEGSREFALQDGVIYTFLDADIQIALQAATGKKLWARRPDGGQSPGLPVSLLGDVVLTRRGSTLAALRRSNGATVWFQTTHEDYTNVFTDAESGGSNWQNPPHARRKQDTLFVTASCVPVLNGVQRTTLRSVKQLDTLIALDAATGRERWRWQPYTGFSIHNLLADKDRLYLSDGTRIVAVEEGLPDPLPTDARQRALLAQRMTAAMFGWPEPKESLLRRAAKYLPGSHPQDNASEQEDRVDWSEASLTLLRLGQDSVPALLDYIHHAVEDGDKTFIVSDVSSGREHPALELLLDIDAPETPLALIRELDRAKDSPLRPMLAATLIRWGDPRALPALFRYVQTSSKEPETRPDALYVVCRTVAAGGPDLPADAPRQEAITAYLMARLQDKKAPGWLRRFAKFELLNGRGDAAWHAALATFRGERTARLLPANPTLTLVPPTATLNYSQDFPTKFQPEAMCRDANGRWWAAFYCSYLDDDHHLWFVQSTDKQHWIKPAFGFNLAALCTPQGSPDKIKLTRYRDRLRVRWSEAIPQPGTHPDRHIWRQTEITIASLYRDRDHDGLTDRIEKAIGTDPNNPDTNGNGIPDGMDKNPLYRPHPLTDEEGIYQAAVEALCQYGRSIPTTKGGPYYWGELIPFGRSTGPLLLFTPPGSASIEIRGHPGIVICRPLPPKDRSFTRLVHAYNSSFFAFCPPHIGLDGAWRDESDTRRIYRPPTDPFVPSPAEPYKQTPSTFRTYFPYVRSRDGNRARIGTGNDDDYEGRLACDIEVQKIGGQWRPVECRPVFRPGWRRAEQTVTPTRNPHEPPPVFAGPHGL